MRKETIEKPDGRYIIYYWFDEGEPPEEEKAGDNTSRQAERDGDGE